MSAEPVQGRRVHSDGARNPAWLEPGDYAFYEGDWWCRPPGYPGYPARLTHHQIVEHDDGTITVSPSILFRASGAYPEWHGYLERGVWRSV